MYTVDGLLQELLPDALSKLARHLMPFPGSALPELLLPGPVGPLGLCVP